LLPLKGYFYYIGNNFKGKEDPRGPGLAYVAGTSIVKGQRSQKGGGKLILMTNDNEKEMRR